MDEIYETYPEIRALETLRQSLIFQGKSSYLNKDKIDELLKEIDIVGDAYLNGRSVSKSTMDKLTEEVYKYIKKDN